MKRKTFKTKIPKKREMKKMDRKLRLRVWKEVQVPREERVLLEREVEGEEDVEEVQLGGELGRGGGRISRRSGPLLV